jgi:hypothetical protein
MFDHGGIPTELVAETVTRFGEEVAPLLQGRVAHVTSAPGKL